MVKIPAIPTTLFFGNPEYFWAITITSKGFVIHITNALGDALIPSATCFMILRFMLQIISSHTWFLWNSKAVIIITSEFFVSS